MPWRGNSFVSIHKVAPQGELPTDKARREEFTPPEYRTLHTKARSEWLKKGYTDIENWYRDMIYYFILLMANTPF